VRDRRDVVAEPGACLAELPAEDGRRVDRADALRAVGDVDRRVEVEQEHADDLAEAERDDREVVAAQLERRRAEQHAEEAGERAPAGITSQIELCMPFGSASLMAGKVSSSCGLASSANR
jgi:hypothetical protein